MKTKSLQVMNSAIKNDWKLTTAVLGSVREFLGQQPTYQSMADFPQLVKLARKNGHTIIFFPDDTFTLFENKNYDDTVDLIYSFDSGHITHNW